MKTCRWSVGVALALCCVGCGSDSDGSGTPSAGGAGGTGAAGGSAGTGGSAATGGSAGLGGSAGTGGAGGSVAPNGWPLGIPEPEFGIHEQAPTTPDALFYYVDNTHPAATDDDNPQGTPNAPRATFPKTLPAGATVIVSGGPYAGDGVSIQASGTAASPVFVIAKDLNQPPRIESPVELSGSYLILEHFDFNGPDSGVSVLTPSNHIVVRHSEVRNGVGGPSAGMYTGRWNPEDDPATAEHIVFWDNRVHDNGDWKATFDEDHHGFAVGHHANHVWVVGNVMYHNSGDGLQINAKKAGLMDTLHHIYAGKNLAYENKQTGLWSKQSTDVIFSQNTIHTHRPSGSSGGSGIGFQYGPERLWIIFNEIYNCEVGISSSTYEGDVDNVPGPGKDIYVIGNLIHGIHKDDGSGPSTDPWQTGAGIRFTDQEATKHVENNTVYDADVGLTYARGTGPLLAANNLFAKILGAHVHIEESAAAAGSKLDHELFDAPGLLRWGSSQGVDVAGLNAAFPGACVACLEADAQLVDPSALDFHAKASSPAVDSGITSTCWPAFQGVFGTSLATDREGTTRPQGAGVDRGAYER
ncbi:MAG: right-handed parallel beta-helix repeat-containing protein [Deltaproteobacteria bacterium]|nr:right-handed parallel beta-helix repeat-containing protein [Deltaproteobacteria bacterium]